MNRILLSVMVALTPSIYGAGREVAPADADIYRHALLIHERAISIDSHTDAPLKWENTGYSSGRRGRNCVNLPKMAEGKLDAQYVAAYVSSSRKINGKQVPFPLSEKTYKNRLTRVYRLIEVVLNEIRKNSDKVGLATSAEDIATLKSNGKKAFLLGVENAICLGTNVDIVDSLARKGVTYITLTHVYDNQIAHSSTHTSDAGLGLTPLGKEVVKRMNDLGIMIDLSHASEGTFYEVLDLSTKPVICSHSGARSICDHDRNLTDDQLRAIAGKDGVVQIVAYKGFLNKVKSKATIKDFVDHIDHAVKVAGIDYVGIGTDFDGGGGIPGLRDDADFINITMELLSRGYSDEDITKILGANFLRVMSAQK